VLQWSPRDPWHLMVGSDDDASPELQVDKLPDVGVTSVDSCNLQ
jgi:hypothetical protein